VGAARLAPATRVRRAFPPLVLVLGSVLVSLAAAEIALRVLGFSHASVWIPDQLTGSRAGAGGRAART
jgi:hypothetical protein